MNPFKNIYDWEFLKEPMWRWFIFFGALIFLSLTWRKILDYMK